MNILIVPLVKLYNKLSKMPSLIAHCNTAFGEDQIVLVPSVYDFDWEDLAKMSQDDADYLIRVGASINWFGRPFTKDELEIMEIRYNYAKLAWAGEDMDLVDNWEDLCEENVQCSNVPRIVKVPIVPTVPQMDNTPVVSAPNASDKRKKLVMDYAEILRKHGNAISSMSGTIKMLKKQKGNKNGKKDEERREICNITLLSYGNVTSLAKKGVDFFAPPSQATIKNLREKESTARSSLLTHQKNTVRSLDQCENSFNARILKVDKSAEKSKQKYLVAPELRDPKYASLTEEEIENKLKDIDRKTFCMMDEIDLERKQAIERLKQENEYIEKSLKERLEKCTKDLEEAEQSLSSKKTKVVSPNLDICTRVLKIVEKNNSDTENFFEMLTHYMTFGEFPVYVPEVVQAPLVAPPVVVAPVVVAPVVVAPVVVAPSVENPAPVQQEKGIRRRAMKHF